MSAAIPGPVTVVADGELGLALAGLLGGLLAAADCQPLIVAEPVSGLPAVLASSQLALRLSWRDVHAEFAAFAAAAAVAGRPWLAVAYAHPYLRVGPAVVRGVAPCHACYLRRARQHDTSGRNGQLDRAYTVDRGLGVAGYLPHQLALAASHALTLAAAAGPRDGAPAVGEVRLIDCRTDEWTRHQVVSAVGCADCDPEAQAQARAYRARARLGQLAPTTRDLRRCP